MGCLCSTPSHHNSNGTHHSGPQSSQPSLSSGHCSRQALAACTAAASPHTASSPEGLVEALEVLTPHEILELAESMFDRHPPYAAHLDVLTPAAVAIIESCGASRSVHFNDDIGEAQIGLCQMTLASAQWLASTRGFNHHGALLTSDDLLDPVMSLYFCTAYLLTLAGVGVDGCAPDVPVGVDLEEYCVRAYHAGPKSWQMGDTGLYWLRYRHAKQQLRSLQAALHAPVGCSMHVVHPNESLSVIASICGVTVADIMAANPDIPHAGAIQAHDCIALPLPRILPRLYVIQPTDAGLPSIARTQGVSLTRLLAKNPNTWSPHLAPPPGWVLLLPGLRSKSEYWSEMPELDVGRRHGSAGAAGFWSPGPMASHHTTSYSTSNAQQYTANPQQYTPHAGATPTSSSAPVNVLSFPVRSSFGSLDASDVSGGVLPTHRYAPGHSEGQLAGQQQQPGSRANAAKISPSSGLSSPALLAALF